jgi:hypothetical protein
MPMDMHWHEKRKSKGHQTSNVEQSLEQMCLQRELNRRVRSRRKCGQIYPTPYLFQNITYESRRTTAPRSLPFFPMTMFADAQAVQYHPTSDALVLTAGKHLSSPFSDLLSRSSRRFVPKRPAEGGSVWARGAKGPRPRSGT